MSQRSIKMFRQGDRIELIFTNNAYTKLKPGDQGTVSMVNRFDGESFDETQIIVKWDCGSSLALIDGVDRFKVLSE